MSESLVAQIFEAAKCLERLQGLGPVTNQKAYSPQELRGIARMLNGEGER
jgi:hypothetical protein